MVTEKIQSWSARIVGPLVVATIIGLVGGGIFLRDAVLKLRTEVAYLKAEAEEGERFTLSMGKSHDSRIKIIEAETSTHEERLDNHVRLQEHEGADRRMREIERRVAIVAGQWRNHTSGTSGRVNRLENLEKTVDKMWAVINSKLSLVDE